MTHKDLVYRISEAVGYYLQDFYRYEPDPHLSVNPVTLYVDVVSGKTMAEGVEDADEALENAAYARGDADEMAMDRQAKENPDFYPIRQFLIVEEGKPTVADPKAIEKLASHYIP